MKQVTRNWMFALICLVTLIASIGVAEALPKVNIGKINPAIVINTLIIFGIAFVITTLTLKDKIKGGVEVFVYLLLFFAAIFAAYKLPDPNAFIWMQNGIRWIFNNGIGFTIKPLVNIAVVVALIMIVEEIFFKEKIKSKLAIFVIAMVFGVLIAHNVAVPEAGTYKDAYIWESWHSLKGVKEYLIGGEGYTKENDYCIQANEQGEAVTKCAILRGTHLFVFVGVSIILSLLFNSKLSFGGEGSKKWMWVLGVIVGAETAHSGLSKSAFLQIAYWWLLILIFRKMRDAGTYPGVAAGLSYGLVNTVGRIFGIGLVGGRSFVWNFVIGYIFGVVYDMLTGKGGILHGREMEQLRGKLGSFLSRRGLNLNRCVKRQNAWLNGFIIRGGLAKVFEHINKRREELKGIYKKIDDDLQLLFEGKAKNVEDTNKRIRTNVLQATNIETDIRKVYEETDKIIQQFHEEYPGSRPKTESEIIEEYKRKEREEKYEKLARLEEEGKIPPTYMWR